MTTARSSKSRGSPAGEAPDSEDGPSRVQLFKRKSSSAHKGDRAKRQKVEEAFDLCPICLDHLKLKTDILATPCGHVFHTVCLVTALQGKPQCPACRTAIKKKFVALRGGHEDSELSENSAQEEEEQVAENEEIEQEGNPEVLDEGEDHEEIIDGEEVDDENEELEQDDSPDYEVNEDETSEDSE